MEQLDNNPESSTASAASTPLAVVRQTPATSPVELPALGGSYLVDPATGAHTRIEYTKNPNEE